MSLELMLIVVWGTLVGLDLVSFPQSMISRPLVAATVAGAIAGDVVAGLRVGVVMELFALDVMPVGAARYPDFGPASVASAWFAAQHGVWQLLLGPAVGIALVTALLGGWSLQWLRRGVSRAVHTVEPQLNAGDRPTLRRLFLLALVADAVRGAALTVVGLLLGVALTAWPIAPMTAATMTLIGIAGGAAAAGGGALRSAGHGGRVRWLLAGSALGLVAALFA